MATDSGGILAVRHWTRRTRVGMTVLAVLVALEAAAFAGTFLLYSRDYVTVRNAQVDGDDIQVNAPVAGRVTGWRLAQGSALRTREVIGRITIDGSGGRPQYVLRAPGSGTVAAVDVTEGEWVDVGDPLATAYGPQGVYVTARVGERDVAAVRVGQAVDLELDAAPGTPVHGVVTEVQASTAGAFEVFPSPDQDTRNPQPVDQYVPVRIAFIDAGGLRPVPGMNVTARIHRDTPATVSPW
jgi:multidrug resistance efflux pump